MRLKSFLAPIIIFQSSGAAWFTKGDYECALADFDLAIASDPGHAGA